MLYSLLVWDLLLLFFLAVELSIKTVLLASDKEKKLHFLNAT